MTEQIQIALKNLPNSPGIYRFYDSANELLYIGKAKNLKNRVKSYFQDELRLLESRGQRINIMVSQIYRLDYTVVKNEKESLILEANLIHSLQPKYNVSLKDDKSYVYIRVTLGDEVPGIFLVRQKFDPKSLYFGPYTKKYGIEQVLRVVRQIFPYCQERRVNGKPCQYVGIHQCDGVCEGKENATEYKAKIDQIVKIFSGQTKPVKKFIETRMKEAAEKQNYALASLWRDRLNILDDTIVDQKVVLVEPLDLDLISLVLEKQEDGQVLGSLFYQAIREGKVNNVLNYLMTGTESILDSENSNLIETERIINAKNTEIELISDSGDLSDGYGTEVEFLSKFLLSFYYKLLDLPEKLYLQVFWREKVTGHSASYLLKESEKEVLEELIPNDVRLMVV